MALIKFGPSFMILENCKHDVSSSFVGIQKPSLLRVLGRKFLGNSSIGPSCSSLLGEVVAELGDFQSIPSFMSFVQYV